MDPHATYTIFNISLEFDTIINASLASQIRTEYMKSSILYDKILRARIIPLNNSDTSFSVDINSRSESQKGVLLIFMKERSATKFDDKNVFIVCGVEGKLNEWIKLFKSMLKGHQTLFIIDNCSAEGEKRDALSELAFSGRHRNHSLWVLTQKYNLVSKDIREQIKWLCLFLQKIEIVSKTV